MNLTHPCCRLNNPHRALRSCLRRNFFQLLLDTGLAAGRLETRVQVEQQKLFGLVTAFDGTQKVGKLGWSELGFWDRAWRKNLWGRVGSEGGWRLWRVDAGQWLCSCDGWFGRDFSWFWGGGSRFRGRFRSPGERIDSSERRVWYKISTS